MLCVGAAGFIQQLPVSSTTVSGLTQDETITPATSGNLGAYWRGGYFGGDAPQRMKTFRFLRMISDQNPKAFKILMRYVDDELRTFQQPELQGPINLAQQRLGLNWKAKRASPEIQFPAQDVDSSVIELQMAHIATSDR